MLCLRCVEKTGVPDFRYLNAYKKPKNVAHTQKQFDFILLCFIIILLICYYYIIIINFFNIYFKYLL